ncbi:MAG: SDR family NAD(P)-dependent oxidoreductase [Armatimonadetes bacterium]|nr:SDR family NAD(P)-dependent oxidoreductase [Armatimonadota bacterium]
MKTVIVTGASSGIGRELSLLLAEKGNKLLLIARRAEELSQVQELCLKAGSPNCAVEAMDVTASNAAEQVASVLDWIGASSSLVLVHGAGIAEFGSFAEQSSTSVRRQLDVLLTAPIMLTQALLPRLLQSHGHVVFVGSIATRNVFSGAEAYSAAKWGLLGFAKSLSEGHRRSGLRVSTVTPGATDTELWGVEAPRRGDMLSARLVAEAILSVIESPENAVIDELVVTPPKGVL